MYASAQRIPEWEGTLEDRLREDDIRMERAAASITNVWR